MKLSELNEYIQTGAALVAIVGIFLLGYEVRQSNALATQQAVSQSWSNWIGWQQSIIESDISSVIAKSVSAPESLTDGDKQKLHSYLLGYLYLFESDFEVFTYTSESVVETETETAVQVLSNVFGFPYAKAWYQEIGYVSLIPGLRERITRELHQQPDNDLEQFFSRIDARLSEAKN